MGAIGIYMISSKIKPERCYIGSSRDITGRWFLHLRQLRKKVHSNIKLQRHFDKYGENDLSFTVITRCEVKDLLRIEQIYIDGQKPWFNICKKAGSHLGAKRTPESCLRISESKKGVKHWTFNRPLSEQTKEKISKSLKGRISPWKGRTASDETRKLMSIKRKGHPNYLHHHSQETKEKIKIANSGIKSYWFGKHHTEETKRKISMTKKKLA